MIPARGPDHAIHPYSPQPARPDFRWPGGARVAVYLLLHIEHTEIEPPADTHRDPRFRGAFFTGTPDWHGWSYRDYGNRIGAWRILDLLDALKLPASVAVNTLAARRHPELIAACAARSATPCGSGRTAGERSIAPGRARVRSTRESRRSLAAGGRGMGARAGASWAVRGSGPQTSAAATTTA